MVRNWKGLSDCNLKKTLLPCDHEPPQRAGEHMTPDELELGIKSMNIDRNAENQKLLAYLYETLDSGKAEVGMLHRKLAYSYWISVGLSILMFLFGLILLSVPVMAVVWGKGTETEAAISGTLGIIDLVALFLIGPLNRIHKLMGNIAQVRRRWRRR